MNQIKKSWQTFGVNKAVTSQKFPKFCFTEIFD